MVFPPLPEQPFCSIVIPCLNEGTHLEGVLRAALGQRYPEDRIEVLVADGGSTDGSRDIVQRLSKVDPRLSLVDNPERFPSAGLNAAIRRARGEVVVRMDAHAEYPLDFLSASVSALRRTGAANVGGAARAKARTRFQRVLCAALSSPLGVGGSAYRDPSREGFVESVWGGAFRREVFERVGLFDAAARCNEDAELNQRIIEAGGGVYLDRAIVAFYYPRTSLSGLALQYFGYGKGRARTLLRRGKLLSLRPLLPFLFVTGLGFAILLGLAFPKAASIPVLAAAVYGLAVAIEAARIAQGSDPRLFPWLLVTFPVMHVAHGLGLWAGLLHHVRSGLPDGRVVAR